MKTLYLIHHSHTDIGYTAPQATVRRRHVAFIRQALAILRQRGLRCGFRWVCESFWAVEQFLAEADERERAAFAEAVRGGAIGLSASYANFSELLDAEALAALVGRAADYGRGIGQPLASAMTADINGFGWGFCRALHEHGVAHLFTCIHTHHGMFPLQRHRPFRWLGPRGAEVLVWNGEHYHLGNELGLAPGAVSSYLIQDECDAQAVYHDPWRVAELRIPRLFEQLERDGYPYDFLPVMISGLRTDNGPPSAAILDQVERWNAAHGGEIRVEMATLDGFFARLREHDAPVPEYRGDWPDWWTDGVASLPGATARMRSAQRTWGLARALRGPGAAPDPDDRRLLDDLALYAEHTYGHAASVVLPHDPQVRSLTARKRAYAAVAEETAQTLLERELARRGAADLAPGLPLRYRVINPHPVRVTAAARLRIEHHEYYENHVYRGLRVLDEADGRPLAAGLDPTPVTTTVLVPLTLEPGETRTLRLQPTLSRELTPDQGRPVLASGAVDEPSGVFATDAFRIEWRRPEGITAWIDTASGRDLLRPDREHAPLLPVASRTPQPDAEAVWSVRGALGLSRSGPDAEWSVARVTAVRESRSGTAPGDPLVAEAADPPVTRRLEFDLEVAGCADCSLQLEATAGLPQVAATLRLNKQNLWAPENLYLSLPFGRGPRDTLWLDRAGAPVRARRDQLPGTLIDYYSLLEGFVAGDGPDAVAVALPDSPLLQLGPLAFQAERVRHDPQRPHPDRALPYAWLMTNYWETNFAAGLGGFHSFRFGVAPAGTAEPEAVLRRMAAETAGLVCFRLAEED